MTAFRVAIGTMTRRGDLQVMVERFVNTEMGQGEVHGHFSNEYKGFVVRVERIETLERIDTTEKAPGAPRGEKVEEERVWRVESMTLDLLTEEKEEVSRINEEVYRLRGAESKLFTEIRVRLKDAGWLDDNQHLELSRDGSRVVLKNARLRWPVIVESIKTPLQN